jgi:diketogulonate reductase-like aldo/keto reductase
MLHAMERLCARVKAWPKEHGGIMATDRTVELRNGEEVSALGLGTWRMGESRSARSGEIAALRAGLDLGLTLIDTAEMYGEGGAEEVVGEAIKGRRDGVFLVSKVYPHNASAKGVVSACERSLKRLGTDRLDLYLLHWRGSIPLADTVKGFERLLADGKVRMWGVSNFDVNDMTELGGIPGGQASAANQVLYHLGARGIDFELIARCRESRAAVMAYSPLGQGQLLKSTCLVQLANKYGVEPAAIALAWLLRQPDVIAIPKASNLSHVAANARALDVTLNAEDLALLDRTFPPPRRATPLEMI